MEGGNIRQFVAGGIRERFLEEKLVIGNRRALEEWTVFLFGCHHLLSALHIARAFSLSYTHPHLLRRKLKTRKGVILSGDRTASRRKNLDFIFFFFLRFHNPIRSVVLTKLCSLYPEMGDRAGTIWARGAILERGCRRVGYVTQRLGLSQSHVWLHFS